MKYKEYYHSALRHLDVCKTMMESLASLSKKGHQAAKRNRLKLDIYYLSGYVIETMISYTFFVNIKWGKNDSIESCDFYNKGFKTHKLSAKLTFAVSRANCDYSGITLLGITISDKTERKMFNEWSEVVRYQHPKSYSGWDFTEDDLKRYISDIDLMFEQLRNKYYD